ncbi:MAG: cobalt ECF transporter T component CbiQ, partial [Candidatus Accumulibacter sp.]|nr:cobalt ECF transporter T component CbiQ [Accumulibacter sp.]
MLIEQAAYGNRWRRVSPAAKGSLALAGLLAAFVAATPATAAFVALLLALTTVLGARVPAGVYLRVAAP